MLGAASTLENTQLLLQNNNHLIMSSVMFQQNGIRERGVDSLFRSALRESAQYSMLRDTLLNRNPATNALSSMVLDANMEASFYWLDQYANERRNGSVMTSRVDETVPSSSSNASDSFTPTE
eukprot:CAMPEP_0185763154 /NCGR_PEP_ID=MMETSP1174-20130828/22113_1 /TAXON_ID=35687 /ORGANISM="Dictyocha speculum, Strain CCMP1381" /LENGTH=121 /DNA_ID=CAMNT_0028445149 /DNA_START=66 /DNA_END=431 /DNA_ORIENTATION=+